MCIPRGLYAQKVLGIVVCLAALGLSIGYHVKAATQIPHPVEFPTVSFDASSYTFTEGGGPTTVTILLSEPCSSPVQVKIQLAYTEQGQTLQFADTVTVPAGQTSQSAVITVEDNGCCQPTLYGTLTVVEVNGIQVPGGATASVTVIDDDQCP